MNKENVIKLADHLEKLDLGESNVRFSMDTFFHEESNCNTPCCIAGHCVALLHPEFDPIQDEEEQGKSIDEIAGDILGLGSIQASNLFAPLPYTNGVSFLAKIGNRRHISREHAVKVLRNLAETGEVDWK